MADKNDDGKLELSLRVLGNELIGIKMVVDDFKMKWLAIGVITPYCNRLGNKHIWSTTNGHI